MKNPSAARESARLRERAEETLRDSEKKTPQMSHAELQALVHELHVHQIELDLQNEELRDTQLALRNSRDMYSELFEFMPAGYVSLDREGMILKANLTASTMLETTRERLTGTSITRHLASEDQAAFFSMSQKCRESRENQTAEIRLLHNSVPLWTQMDMRLHATQQDEMLLAFSDISTRKRVEEELTAQNARLTHFSRINSIGSMIAGISHEINQPLQAIAVFAATCEKKLAQRGFADDDDVVDHLRQISTLTLRSGDVIKRIRNFVSKSERVRALQSINHIVEESAQLAKPEARRQKAITHLTLESELPRVWVDEVQIQQVIVNLLKNAFDSLEKPHDLHTVNVRSRLISDGVEVTVEDQGAGLTPEAAKHMYEGFFSTKPDGMGLGLAISRTIIESHGGRLWATANPVRGTSFRFQLPVA